MDKKCHICGKKIEETFLGKIKGTLVYLNEEDGKKAVYICSDCQREHPNLEKDISSEKPA